MCGCTCCSVVMSWIMVGAQAAALALLVCSRPFAWAPTVRRLWARQRAWQAVRNGGSRVPPPGNAPVLYVPPAAQP